MRRGLTAALAALLIVGLAACGSDATGQSKQSEQSEREAPKTFASDRELVEEFLKDMQAGEVSRAPNCCRKRRSPSSPTRMRKPCRHDCRTPPSTR